MPQNELLTVTTKSNRWDAVEHISLVQYLSCPSSFDRLVSLILVVEDHEETLLTEAEEEDRRRCNGLKNSG
jgi:hypothetical protein